MLDRRLQALDRLIAERKLQEAVAWGEQLCRDHADCLPAQLSLSEAYRQQGRFQAAREHAASAHDLNPDDEFARAQYARTLIPFADHQQHTGLDRHQKQNACGDKKRAGCNGRQIHGHADRNEEQPEQKAFEGFHLGFDFMAEFRIGHQYACHERSQAHR